MVANRKPRPRRNTGDGEVAIAQRDQLRDQLRAVLALIDRRSFMPAPQQEVVATADALLAESERW